MIKESEIETNIPQCGVKLRQQIFHIVLCTAYTSSKKLHKLQGRQGGKFYKDTQTTFTAYVQDPKLKNICNSSASTTGMCTLSQWCFISIFFQLLLLLPTCLLIRLLEYSTGGWLITHCNEILKPRHLESW